MERLYTLKETSDLLRIKIKTLYNWRSRGIIPKVKRYTESEVLEIGRQFRENKLAS